MRKTSVLFLSVIVAVSFVLPSCSDDFEDVVCTCDRGGSIGGWENGNSTDIVSPPDSVIPGPPVILKDWNDTIRKDLVI